MDIQTLKRNGQIIEVPIDEYLFYQGEAGKHAYFILKGRVEVLVSSRGDGSLFKLADLKEGSILGEMALLDDQRRSASIRTLTDCVFLTIDEVHFENLVKQEPAMALKLLETLAGRLKGLHQRLTVMPVKTATESWIQTMKPNLSAVSLQKGQTLYQKGEHGDTMAYILEGSVMVSGPDEFDLKGFISCGTGSLVGFANVIFAGTRYETIEAIEDCRVIIIDKSLLQAFFDGYPQAYKELVQALCNEIRHYNNTLMLQESKASAGYQIIESKDGFISKSPSPKRGTELFEGLQLNDYVSRKEVSCPICGERIEVLSIRHSKLQLESITNEYRRIYKTFDDLWYHIWSCPKCRYHNYAHDFFNLSIQENYNLKKRLLNQSRKDNFRYIPKKKGSLNHVINEHFNLLLCKKLAASSSLRQGKVWLHLAWLNDDAGNSMERDEAYRKARTLYHDGLLTHKEPLLSEEEQQLSILLGELYLRDGHYKEAREYLLRAVHKEGNKVFNRQAEHRLHEIRDIMTEDMQKNAQLF